MVQIPSGTLSNFPTPNAPLVCIELLPLVTIHISLLQYEKISFTYFLPTISDPGPLQYLTKLLYSQRPTGLYRVIALGYNIYIIITVRKICFTYFLPTISGPGPLQYFTKLPFSELLLDLYSYCPWLPYMYLHYSTKKSALLTFSPLPVFQVPCSTLPIFPFPNASLISIELLPLVTIYIIITE